MVVLKLSVLGMSGDHKGMPKVSSEVNSLPCCASLLVSVTCTAVVKSTYNLLAINSFYLWYSLYFRLE